MEAPPNEWKLWGIVPEGRRAEIVTQVPQHKGGERVHDLCLWRIPLVWEHGAEPFYVYSWKSGPSDWDKLEPGQELILTGQFDVAGGAIRLLTRGY